MLGIGLKNPDRDLKLTTVEPLITHFPWWTAQAVPYEGHGFTEVG